LENITHSLAGFFLSRAGLNRFTPQATPLLLVSANLPDIDLLTVAGGGLNYFHYHRHITHSLIFAPVLAAALVGIFRLILRKPFPLLPAFLVALAGVASHLLLDLTNDYGIRLFLPFSNRWPALDICSIYDFWIWSFFGLCLAGSFLSKLIGGEIGSASRQRYPPSASARIALSLLLLYDGARYVLHGRALAVLNAREYDDAPAVRVAAFPQPANPFSWQGLAQTEGGYRLYDLNLLSTFDPTGFRFLETQQPTPQMEAAARTEPFRILSNFARFPVWRQPPGEETVVTLRDVRFPFYCTAVPGAGGTVQSSTFHFR
jgi:inner membrane protein